MYATDISCRSCGRWSWCPDSGFPACSEWVDNGNLIVFDEVGI